MAELTPFAAWLAEEMRARGWTQSKLARYIDRKPQTVSSWFNDGRIPGTELCFVLARVLHLSVEDVLRRAGHLPEDYEPTGFGEVRDPIIPELRELLAVTPREDQLMLFEVAQTILRGVRHSREP